MGWSPVLILTAWADRLPCGRRRPVSLCRRLWRKMCARLSPSAGSEGRASTRRLGLNVGILDSFCPTPGLPAADGSVDGDG